MRCPPRFRSAAVFFMVAIAFSSTAQITVQSSVAPPFLPDSLEKQLPLVRIDANRYSSQISCRWGCGGDCTPSRAAVLTMNFNYTDKSNEPRYKYLTTGLPMNNGLHKGIFSLPLSWLESLSLNSNSLQAEQGFESPSGIIMTELWNGNREMNKDLKAGIEISHLGELTSDVMATYRIKDHISGKLFYHVGYMGAKHDLNDDGFLDVPLTEDMRIMNTWKVQKNNVSDKIHTFRSEFGVAYTYQNETSGEKDFAPEAGSDTLLHYGAQLQTSHLSVFSKNMMTLDKGLVRVDATATMDDQKGFYGVKKYSGESNDLWIRAMFSTTKSTRHVYTGGMSYQVSGYQENLQSIHQSRTEQTAGAFGKYQFNDGNFRPSAGMRLDYHNLYGLFYSPSATVLYVRSKWSVSGGIDRRYRVPKALSENLEYANSARTFELAEAMQPERSWNFRAGTTRLIRNVYCRLDYEHIEFQNKLVADLDAAQKVVLYNSNTRSFEDRVTFYADYMWNNKLQVDARYIFSNVMTAYKTGMEKEPFVPHHALTTSVSYSIGGALSPSWVFAMAGQFIGKQRLPNTSAHPEQYRWEDTSPGFFLLNARVSKHYKKWEFYAGASNLLNVRMNNPVLAADQPFSPYFDASMQWGAVAGAKAYAGVNFSLYPQQ